MKPTSPDAEQIKASRLHAGFSQRVCAELIYVSRRAWQTYEDGTVTMKTGLWELFLFKTGQLWIKPMSPKAERKAGQRPGRVENLRPYTAKALQE